jgi:CHAT domain-containing protein
LEGVKNLILMPSGGLQLLPLHVAWREVDGTPRSLLDDTTITYAPSGYALKASLERAGERTDTSAVVGGINKYVKLSPLFNAVDEALAIAELFEAEALTDGTATKEAVTQAVGGSAFLHLSCHGSFGWQEARESALYLANDEPLPLREILNLRLEQMRLVTLSACETGITDWRETPDEFVGLPAAFIQAGAPAVVSSLWVVDDRSTALLMERFYKNHLERDMPFPEALREAQLWLRDATREELGEYYEAMLRVRLPEKVASEEAAKMMLGDPDDRPYTSPFYWAAFTYTGA